MFEPARLQWVHQFSTVPPEQAYDAACNCCRTPEEGSPILITLGNNSVEFSSPGEGILFDLFAIQRSVNVSWPVGDQRAYWLALDRNGNGVVDDGAELFGNVTRLADGTRGPHGYVALAEFDQNGDRRINSADKVYRSLVLWRRRLPIGSVVRADEYIHLSEAGIEEISLDVRESRKRDQWGNEFRYRGRVRLLGGEVRWSYDVFLAYMQP